MNLEFTKMQGLGNDFVVFSGSDLFRVGGSELINNWQNAASHWAKILCDQHFGVGADGLIVVFDKQQAPETIPPFVKDYPSSADTRFAWTYTNKDGSASLMCGNGLRCVAQFLKHSNLFYGDATVVSTAVGDIPMTFDSSGLITCDLGAPRLKAQDIPVLSANFKAAAGESESFIRENLRVKVGAESFALKGTCVNMGNPHCVIFDDVRGHNCEELTDANLSYLQKVAESLQTSGDFPEGVNVEFVHVNSAKNAEVDSDIDKLRVIVFERGCGRTLACASGAGAVLVAGVLEGRANRTAVVQLEGGDLRVEWSSHNQHVLLKGPAEIVYAGVLHGEALHKKLLNLPSEVLKSIKSTKSETAETLEVVR